MTENAQSSAEPVDGAQSFCSLAPIEPTARVDWSIGEMHASRARPEFAEICGDYPSGPTLSVPGETLPVVQKLSGRASGPRPSVIGVGAPCHWGLGPCH